MFTQFILHVLISSLIFYVLATGARFFMKLRGSIDFSYLGIVIVASYVGAWCNIHRGWSMLACMCISFIAALPFGGFLVYCSRRLKGIYFTLGSLAIYLLMYQLAYTLTERTGGSYGMTGMTRIVFPGVVLDELTGYLVFVVMVTAGVAVFLTWVKQTYLYRTLQARAQRPQALRALGVGETWYHLVVFLVTTLCAVIGGNLFSFYYLYIDPATFWLPMLLVILVLMFASYTLNEWGTLGVTIVLLSLYEGLRRVDLGAAVHVGYSREMLFALLVMGMSLYLFRAHKVLRIQ